MALDLGNVPAWLGAMSLPLAISIFVRDRRNEERSQVDRVGVWCSAKYDRAAPWEPMIHIGDVTLSVRNASDLPIEIAQVAYSIATRWAVADRSQWDPPESKDLFTGSGVWMVEPGITIQHKFVNEFRVAPQDTVNHDSPFDVRHMAPQDAWQLDLQNGVVAMVEWVLVIDNAGRRWELRPTKGRRAKRARWYRRRKAHYPAGW